MNLPENPVMICLGVLLAVSAFFVTGFTRALFSKKPQHPATLGLRLILLGFGVAMIVLGLSRVLHK